MDFNGLMKQEAICHAYGNTDIFEPIYLIRIHCYFYMYTNQTNLTPLTANSGIKLPLFTIQSISKVKKIQPHILTL